ncbi:MAG: hypothetical protein EOM05_06095 [Clostridia bacterium]|nr:hypothetical protein [Clostridia bacterium]
MSSTSKTPNLNLNKWIGSDIPKRADFNYDNETLDDICGNHISDIDIHITTEERALWNTQCVEGTYFGTGGTEREITLDFKPKAVIVFSYNKPFGLANTTDCYAAISTQFINSIGIDFTETGFKTYHGSTHSVDGIIPMFNVVGMDYAYLAFK